MTAREYTEEEIIEHLRNGNSLLPKELSPAMSDNKTIMLQVLKHDGWMLEYASQRLQDDEDIVLTAIKNDGWAYSHASARLQKEAKIAAAAARHDSNILGAVPDNAAMCYGTVCARVD